MLDSLRIAMLLTDGFGAMGGIAKFNRDFLQALDASVDVARVHALPRLVPARIDEPIPESVVYDRKAARGKLAYLRRMLSHAWLGPRADLVICGHMNLLPAAWLLARLKGARLALIVHGIEAWGKRSAVISAMARGVDSFISVSHCTAERTAAWSKAPRDRFFILPNCVDLSRFLPAPRNDALAQRYGLQTHRVLLTMGRLDQNERYKGFDEVIEVMPRLLASFPALKYLIVGGGSDQPRLEAKVESLGLSGAVIFAGLIAEAEKVAHYNLADVFVMPSYGEGFGIVLIEAAACGVPVVGSSADGSREALLEGRLGRLIDPHDPSALIDAVMAALAGPAVHERNDAVATFDVAHFRARVAEWLQQQKRSVRPGKSAG
jgi:phosphatidylinositol alpha-1,6-mannosyltransferase